MKTVEEIYNEMLEVFRRETGAEASAVSDLSVKLYAVAAQVYGLYAQAEWLSRQCFPQTAEGEYLDRHAALRGLERRRAGAAEGLLRFSVDSPGGADLSIPKGTVCATAGLWRFETVEEACLPAGESWVEVAARALEPGAGGNVPAGSILMMVVPPVGISRCINAAPFSGGTDEEGDEALRARVLETYRRMPNGANSAFYEQGALTFDQVSACAVLPRSRGVGTVDVVVSAQGGLPGAELLEKVEAYFQRCREIAVDVRVRAPEVKSVDVSVRVTAREGASPAGVKALVEQCIREYFSGERLGENILKAKLNQLVFSLPEVANCGVLIPANDVVIGAAELPQLGVLTVEVTA
ncbi:MAG: baseplate J/gp47 family protein [Oscillospiraceae bacterium]|nr:baseplate J/gp47 family protein [Oscillospiraceae bacterium]